MERADMWKRLTILALVAILSMPLIAFTAAPNAGATSANWTVRSVDIIELQATKLAIDNNNGIHISYFTWNGNLWYATNSNPLGNWTIEQIETSGGVRGISMALDSNNKAHIGYYVGGVGEMRYATNANGNFVIQVVDDDPYILYESSIAVDSANKVHMSYVRSSDQHLVYATNAGGSWNITEVSEIYKVFNPTSLAVGSDNVVRIAYHASRFYTSNSTTVYSLRYAWKTGVTWNNETIVSNGPAQYASDMKLDQLDRPHIAYLWKNTTAPYNPRVMYALRSPSGWSTPYKVSDIVSNFPPTISLITDTANEVHISYDDYGTGLFYASSAGGWSVENIVPSTNSGRGSSIGMDENGKFYISYFDPGTIFGTVRLKYATTAILPSEPWNFVATPGPNQIQLQWSQPNSTGDYPRLGYRIDLYNHDPASEPNVWPIMSKAVPASNTSHTLTGLYNGGWYWVVIKATSSAGESDSSPVLFVVPGDLPTVPVGFFAAVVINNITLSWSPPTYSNASAVTNYSLFWGLTTTTMTNEVMLGDELSFIHHDLTPGQFYYYKVRAKNGIGWGPFTQVVGAMARGDLPLAPQGLTATAGEGSVTLTWSPPPIGLTTPVDTYYLFRGNSAGGIATVAFATVPVGASTYTDISVTNGQTYYYVVAAKNPYGIGPPSNVASATPTGTAPPPDDGGGMNMTVLIIVALVVLLAIIGVAVVMIRRRH